MRWFIICVSIMLLCMMDACIIDDICEEVATEPNMLPEELRECCGCPVEPLALTVLAGGTFAGAMEVAVFAEALRDRPLLILRRRAASWRFTRLAQWSPGIGSEECLLMRCLVLLLCGAC